MKGKKVFTKTEAKGIRALLDKKMVSDTNEQKNIRDFLHTTHHFFIQDFSNSKNFSPVDFDELVSSGKITIVSDHD